MSKNFDIIHGNPSQCLFAMVLPMMAAMFLNMAYNLVDSLWIGNLLGESAYAALTAATPILLLLNSIAMGATNGVAILLSQAIGAGETRRTRTILFTSFILSIVFSLGMTGLLEGMVSPLLRFLQVPSELYEMTCLYLRIYLIGYGAVYLYCYFAAVLRSFGDTVFQMLAMPMLSQAQIQTVDYNTFRSMDLDCRARQRRRFCLREFVWGLWCVI